MTDQKKNSDGPSDEDWAMSEPEIPVMEASQADQESNAVASLYDPLETGDLEGWDISAADVAMRSEPTPGRESVDAPSPLEIPASDAAGSESPFGFDVPRASFEILRPVAPPPADSEDWAVKQAQSEGSGDWKMPQPEFRVSAGRSAKDAEHPAAIADEQVAENLVEIYEPPDSQDVEERESDVFQAAVPESETEEQFEYQVETLSPLSAAEFPPTKKKSGSGKKWILISLGILAVGLIAGLIVIAAFGLFVFKAR